MTSRAAAALEPRFRALIQALAGGGAPATSAASDSWWGRIHDHYTEQGRFYHTLNHLADMYNHFDGVAAQISRPLVVEQAIFFHDIVYDAKAKDNEAQSAVVYQKFAADVGVDAESSGLVSAYILHTAHHTDPTSDPDLQLFLDIDLAVLGRAKDDYPAYAEEIRKEYCHVPDGTYHSARAAVLKKFASGELYKSEYFRARLDAAARQNLNSEISALEEWVEGAPQPAGARSFPWMFAGRS